MSSHVRSLGALVSAAVLLLGACATDDATTTSPATSPTPAWSQEVVPTPEQLASVLATEDDFDGEWTVNVPPDAADGVSGVVPPEQQEMLPRLDLCDRASEESIAAVKALRWQAFRQLDMTEDDPVDFAAGDMSGHMNFVQEFLLADEPSQVESTFTALRDGSQACLGEIPAGEEGPGKVEQMNIPAVGDDRYGELLTMEEAGGGAQWRLHQVFVRDGSVLMFIDVAEIVAGEGTEPQFTTEDIDTFITTAVAKLP
jgi:hypothetical protein